MKKFRIAYGLGGGFGGATWDDEVYEFENKDDAIDFAFEQSCETYDSYAGYHGLRSVDDIIEEDEVDCDEAEEIYREERETWLDFDAEEIFEEEENK